MASKLSPYGSVSLIFLLFVQYLFSIHYQGSLFFNCLPVHLILKSRQNNCRLDLSRFDVRIIFEWVLLFSVHFWLFLLWAGKYGFLDEKLSKPPPVCVANLHVPFPFCGAVFFHLVPSLRVLCTSFFSTLASSNADIPSIVEGNSLTSCNTTSCHNSGPNFHCLT